jgi:uncharacterized protein YcnI
MKRHLALGGLAGLAALVIAGSASAHAHISPPIALAKEGQVFTLAVPTEKEGARTTTIALTPPARFDIDSFEPAPGWRRSTANGTITWTGGSVPTDEDAVFSFLASADTAGTYRFTVRQTYSDGSVVDWSGPESSDTPAPVLKAVGSFGGGTSALTIAALVLGAVGVVLGAIAVLARSGRALA